MQKEDFKLNGVSFQKRFVTLHETEEKWSAWAAENGVFGNLREPARTESIKEAWKMAQSEAEPETQVKNNRRNKNNNTAPTE